MALSTHFQAVASGAFVNLDALEIDRVTQWYLRGASLRNMARRFF